MHTRCLLHNTHPSEPLSIFRSTYLNNISENEVCGSSGSIKPGVTISTQGLCCMQSCSHSYLLTLIDYFGYVRCVGWLVGWFICVSSGFLS